MIFCIEIYCATFDKAAYRILDKTTVAASIQGAFTFIKVCKKFVFLLAFNIVRRYSSMSHENLGISMNFQYQKYENGLIFGNWIGFPRKSGRFGTFECGNLSVFHDSCDPLRQKNLQYGEFLSVYGFPSDETNVFENPTTQPIRAHLMKNNPLGLCLNFDVLA